MVVIRILLGPLRSSAIKLSGLNINKNSMVTSARFLSQFDVTKNIQLISKKSDYKLKNFTVNNENQRPCVILLAWMMAKRKHMQKFVDYYLQREFDVLYVSLTPWQLLWPTKGTQVIASDILKFLERNYVNSSCVVHGFSVGAYLWGEVMVQIASQQERYKAVTEKIAGQVFDSAADLTELSIGLPFAVFPSNQVLQKALAQYIQYHLKTFDKVATRHYVRASQMFHTNIITAPALFFLSKTDPIGALSSNLRVRENWENIGIKVYWKCWDKSPHVGHFLKYREEYVECLNKFLEDIGLGNGRIHQKFQAKL